MNVLEARRQFFNGAATDSGTTCPCCERFGQVDPYPLTRRLTQLVIALVQSNFKSGHYRGFPRVPGKNGKMVKVTNYNILRHFGLLKPVGGGVWEVTELASKFVNEGARIPTNVYIYNSKCLGVSFSSVTCSQALKGERVKELERPVAHFEQDDDAAHKSIEDARAEHQAALEKGTRCVVCDKYNKVYVYCIKPETAKWLERLACQSSPKAAYSEELDAVSGDYIYLPHWGLAEQAKGGWKITDKGFEFVCGETTVQANIMILNNEPVGFRGKQVTFEDCLKNDPNSWRAA